MAGPKLGKVRKNCQKTSSKRIMDCIAENLQRLHERGVTVEKMSEATQIPRPIMSLLKNGAYHNSVNLDRVVALLDLCGYELVVQKKKDLRHVLASFEEGGEAVSKTGRT